MAMATTSMAHNMMRLCIGLILILLSTSSQAFAPTAKIRLSKIIDTHHHPFLHPRCSHHASQTLLYAGLFGKKEEKDTSTPSQQSASTESDASLVPTQVLKIPVQSLKKGGLRFALGLHLVGLQDKGTWKPNQPNENQLDIYFKDQSAMFSIVLKDDVICIDRYGTPSLVYMLQESVVLHSVLDELNTLAFEGDIEAGNRLLCLEEPCDAIEKARATLPARKA